MLFERPAAEARSNVDGSNALPGTAIERTMIRRGARLVALMQDDLGPRRSVTLPAVVPPEVASAQRGGDRLRVLFVGNTTYHLPLDRTLARKWDGVGSNLEIRVLGAAGRCTASDPRFMLLSAGGAPFLLRALPALARLLRSWRPDVVVAKSPYEGAVVELVRRVVPAPKTRLVVEVHGDWRSASRFYGSSRRRLIAPLADRVAAWGLRSADATRALSDWTASLVRETTGRPPAAIFPTYFDLTSFVADKPRVLPQQPQVLWVGALQPVKNVDALVGAWRLVAQRLPDARLAIVGDGPLRPQIAELVAAAPDRVVHHARLTPVEVAAIMDASTALFLPSLSEGLGRVVLEAFQRARPVVGSSVGGICDLVMPEESGLLREPHDVAGFAADLVRLLADRPLAARMGQAGHRSISQQAPWTSERYADEVRKMVTAALEAPDGAAAAGRVTAP